MLPDSTTEHDTEKFIPSAGVLADDTEGIFAFGRTGEQLEGILDSNDKQQSTTIGRE